MEILLISSLTSLMTGLITGLVVFSLLKPKPKKARKRSAKKQTVGRAMNATALNAAVDFQKIKTAEIEIPVIAEDVLEYEPGELGEAYPEKTRLFYSAEAISDPEYLETVKRSAFQVQTHQKNTSEYNRDVDGWPTEVWWDAERKRVMTRGVLHGEKNVEYAAENKNLPGFGTSAYISFLRVEKTPGTAPNGKPYDAIVKKAVNNHIAILPGIRDPKNVIVAMNAVEAENSIDSGNQDGKPDKSIWERARKAVEEENHELLHTLATDIFNSISGKNSHGRNSMDKDEFKAAMNEYEADKKKEEEAANRIKNAVLNELKSSPGDKPVTSSSPGGENCGKGKNAETSTSTKTSAGNTDEADKKKEEEAANALNALPSQEMVTDFSTNLGVTFPKTPSLRELASLVGIKETEPAALISALNAKREELKKPQTSTDAQNSKTSLADLMNVI